MRATHLTGRSLQRMSISRYIPVTGDLSTSGRLRALVTVLALFGLISIGACTVPVTQPPPPGGDRLLSQAEKLARDGNHAGAAQSYESLAAQSPGELKDRFLLRAARQYLLDNQADKATGLLTQVSTTLPSSDYPMRAQIAADLALRAQRPERALAELDRVSAPVPREYASDILELRARALFALGRPAQGVTTALERERLLSGTDEIRANQRLIWQGLQRSASSNADFTPPAGASALLIGWLDLGRAALTAARNPFTANRDLTDWRARYPTHPANVLLSEDVLPELGVGLDYPSQIALVLPLSGRQQAAGVAVRDGFLAALLEQQSDKRPLLNVYDSAELGATTAYRRAITEGAQFIVGPLMKEEVAAIATSGEASVLTLALNQLPEGAQVPGLMFQFSLDPEDEARQIAQRVTADGRVRGLVLLPNNEWGQRLHRAFETELQLLGGSVAGVRFYDPQARDYSEPIAQMLLINESRTRYNSLAGMLGQRLEFEPRHRGDAQFVFMGAQQPVQGRSLRPALRFHLGDELPVYANSDIFEPDAEANNDLEGLLFPDMPWVISPDAVSTQLRNALSKHWPVRARGRGRLYAFGFDAYRMIPILKAGKFGIGNAVPGMTGLLSIDDHGRVRRELSWAKVTNGQPTQVNATAATAGR
jgi:outer membrane PBP1 activator LpoA protein